MVKEKTKIKKKSSNTKLKADKSATQAEPVENETNKSSGIWEDARFQHLLTDPRFRHLPKKQRKIKIDKRFEGMFTDEKFKVKYTVDKYGRPVSKSNADDLRKYYELDENSSSDADSKGVEATADSDDDEEQERRAEELAISRDTEKGATDDLGNDELESDGEIVPDSIRERLLDPNIDYARGEGHLVTDSSSDEESSDDDDANDPVLQIDHVWGELDCEAETTEESSRRLAVCNMDWDRIRAEDIMVLLNSFLPPGGTVLSVKIYASEFGKQRMAEEEVNGPTELVTSEKKIDDDDSGENEDDDDDDDELVKEQDSDAEEGDDYHMEKLRQYQLNRLRYYYAVVECDSIATADKLYRECDGVEYESSATRVDLRYIPDDTTFDDEPTDVCTELPDANNYKPRQFTTTALQQAKVDLTWDETALERRELGDKLSSGKLEQISDNDLRQIVAYSSEEDSEDAVSEKEENKTATLPTTTVTASVTAPTGEKDRAAKKKAKKADAINKYKTLIAEIKDQEMSKKKSNKFEMEMSWDVNETADALSKTQEDEQNTKQNLTPIEKVLLKRNEKNRKRKDERRRKKLMAKGIDPEDPNANDSDDSIPDGIDMNDAYFTEEFANGQFEEPKSKQKKSKSKKQITENAADAEAAEKQAKELELLVEDNDGKQHFSLEKIIKAEQSSATSKRKRRKQLKKSKQTEDEKSPVDDFQLNLNDPRFNAIYTSHEYNIDPTHSHFKKTKGMDVLIEEKLKRRYEQENNVEAPVAPKRSKKKLENSLLVKSLKRKIQMKQNK